MRFFDIKTNIIPRVDPNCDSISESLKFLKEFRERNIHKICSSPNYFDVGHNKIEEIVIDIQKEASKIENFEIPEIYTSILYPINIDLIGLENISSVNNSRFLLCKFPTYGTPVNYLEKLNYLINNNYIPVLTNIDNFIETLGDNKRKWIKAINKKMKSNRNLGISLLFSKKAPDTKELKKAKLKLDKLNTCESI